MQVSILIPIRGNKFLGLRRSETSSFGGFWNFPGGSVDPGEFTAGAAVRELEEESGLTVSEDDISFFGTVEVHDKMLYFYVTTEAKGEVKINSESSEYAWITVDEIPNYEFIQLNKALVEGLARYINERS
jgi:mutator protein MutT